MAPSRGSEPFLTFLDTGIFIAAYRMENPVLARKAIQIIEDPARTLACSQIVRLEALWKPVWLKRRDEVAFLEACFSRISVWAPLTDEVARLAFREAGHHGIDTRDALHVAAAISVRAVELITTELPAKPMFRTRGLKVVSLAGQGS